MAMSWARSWNGSVLATKSVSQRRSTRTADAAAVDVAVDESLAGRPVGALAGGGDALLAQDEAGLIHIAVGFGEGLAAVHDTCAGLGAEFP